MTRFQHVCILQPSRTFTSPDGNTIITHDGQDPPTQAQLDASYQVCYDKWLNAKSFVLVPDSVTKQQFIQQLFNENLFTLAKDFVNSTAIPEGPQREYAKAVWLHFGVVPRNGPVVELILTHLGKDAAGMDDFFRNASLL